MDPLDHVNNSSGMLIREMKPVLPASMIPMVIKPDCRYGHGLLVRQPSTYSVRKNAGVLQEEDGGPRYIVPSRTAFSVTLWRCQVCAYIEFFDPDEMTTEDEDADAEGSMLFRVPYMGTEPNRVSRRPIGLSQTGMV